ncbi:MAG: peptidylprolyl isomerase [Pseudomonadota bacterium]
MLRHAYHVLGIALLAWSTTATAQTAAEPAATKTAPAKVAPKTAGNPVVVIETSKGRIVAELFPDKAPRSVENFIAYADAKFYDGLVFHRVIDGFMIQGGGYSADLQPRQVRAPIPLEAGRGLSNKRGTLALARTAAPDSATSQFFINLVDNDRLDSYGGGYAVFGRVTEGMQVVDAIAKVKTAPRAGQQDAPVEPVILKSVRVTKR